MAPAGGVPRGPAHRGSRTCHRFAMRIRKVRISGAEFGRGALWPRESRRGAKVKMARPFWFAPWATHVAFRQLVLEGCPHCPGTRTGGCIRPLSRRAGSAAGRCETAMTSSPFISDSDRRSTPPRSAVASRERDGDVRRSRRAVARMAGRCTIILIHDDQFRRQGCTRLGGRPDHA